MTIFIFGFLALLPQEVNAAPEQDVEPLVIWYDNSAVPVSVRNAHECSRMIKGMIQTRYQLNNEGVRII